jgi:hypothetical protein
MHLEDNLDASARAMAAEVTADPMAQDHLVVAVPMVPVKDQALKHRKHQRPLTLQMTLVVAEAMLLSLTRTALTKTEKKYNFYIGTLSQ